MPLVGVVESHFHALSIGVPLMSGRKIVFLAVFQTLLRRDKSERYSESLFSWKPVLGGKLLGISTGRGLGALKGLREVLSGRTIASLTPFTSRNPCWGKILRT